MFFLGRAANKIYKSLSSEEGVGSELGGDIIEDDDPEKNCPKCEEMAEFLADHFRKNKVNIVEELQHAEEVTNKEVLEVGDCVNKIVNNVRHHISESSEAVEASFRRQNESLDEFINYARQAVESQNNIMEEINELSSKIISAGQSINHLSSEARLIALNARIEATRLGTVGNAFGVIADRMSTLSTEINNTNQLIGDAASSIHTCLPALTESGERQVKELEKFMGELEEIKEKVQGAIKSDSSEGDTRLDETLRLSYAALSHLQFQDPMIQKLREIKMAVEGLQSGLEHITELPLSQGLGRTQDDRGESGDENDSGDGQQAGSVMLF